MAGIADREKLEDIQLACAAQRGDRHAFHDLILQHQKGVVNVVYRMCGDKDLAEEAAQEAWIRAWQHLDQYKPKYSFRNWIYKIAVNAALDALRKEPIQVNIEDLPLESLASRPEKEIEQQEQAAAVRKAVLALPEAGRTVLVLREYEGLSYQEIAETLSIPLGTVMSRLNYARTQLRQILAPYLEA